MRTERKIYPGDKIETRNAIATDWPRFLERSLPETPYVFLPNMGKSTVAYAERLGVSSLLFSGGEDWGIFPERDESEEHLFAWAERNDLPILGVCRGAQVINMLRGGKTHACRGHVATRHDIRLTKNTLPKFARVNSFHNNCMDRDDLGLGLEPFAFAEDGTVEGFWGTCGKICGIMWHPEREDMPSPLDIPLAREIFGGAAHAKV